MPIDFIFMESYKPQFEDIRGFLVFFPSTAEILIGTICVAVKMLMHLFSGSDEKLKSDCNPWACVFPQ